ncbi:MAG: flagella rod-binding protein [Bacteroidetes bacterium HLUCCA01]|nr:MAG: flagella rod-binding protein [Bacteroidetes bacterium HLUCCA01]
MNVDNTISLTPAVVSATRHEEIRKEQTAVQFEELFARHLVTEMTKNNFSMTDNMSGVGGSSASMYREFVTDALSTTLAAQRKLGMADMIMQHWTPAQQDSNSDES